MFASFIAQLAARSEPAVRWSGPSGDLELTGAVFANWIYKSTALWEDYGASGLAVITDGHLHWRAAAGMLAAAGLGLPVSVLEADSPAPDGAHMALVPAGMEQASAAFDADEVFVYATEPLALTTDVPEDFLDFITEVRTLPDVLPLAYTQQLRLDVKGRTLSVPIPEEPGSDAVLPAFPTDEVELTNALRALLGGILTLG
ncbi:hypothetical protein HMPREF3172_03100 [Brevibacterium sp. HMSC08F02]|uniref:hypothetical protein n=1 Tax=Brevibacterium sp. HMSC08F02 TaxID=1581140 RepID=UPI0008A45261|nr:hypothetical protein [Brevibacterium sp. HMSC08F02]OFT26607.1 hypothetical protein HMPREF3172_03100 [Brevibacterium sp. HMSC08F02]